MLRLFVLLASAPVALNAQSSNLLPPFGSLSVSTDSGASFSFSSYIQVASFGGSLALGEQFPRGLAVRPAADSGSTARPFACQPLAPLPPGTAVLASRGNCSFAQKALAAQEAGAAALLLMDGLPGKYLASLASQPGSGPLSAGQCDLDCAAFSTTVPAARATLAEALGGYPDLCSVSACPSRLCALAPAGAGAGAGTPRRLCCVPNDYLLVGAGGAAQGVTLPIAWLTAGDGAALLQAASAPASAATLRVLPALRPTPTFDASGLLLWALGTAVAGTASYAAGAAERKARSRGSPTSSTSSPASEALDVWGGGMAVESVELTPRAACAMLAIASAFLGSLYLLTTWGVPIVYAVIALFCAGATASFAAVAAIPALKAAARACRPAALTATVHTPAWLASPLGLPPTLHALSLAAHTLSAACVAAWLFTRHGPAAWLAQDLFGACLCITAVSTLRLTSLRSAALLLGALFVYDVFMVFGTPLLLPSGQSVMVEVATAGAQAPIPPTAGLSTPACYCRLFPADWRVCAPGELMPILFAMPRLRDWRGGYSMLGLGDIVVPALALAVALRFDYAGAGGGGGGGRGEEERQGLLGRGEEGEGEGEEGQALAVGAEGSGSGLAAGAEAGSGARSSSSSAASPRRRAVSPAEESRGAEAGTALPLPLQDPTATAGSRKPSSWLSPSLWGAGMLGYGLGLALAQVAVVAMGLGQPALLYLVPCVLLPIAGLAAWRGQLHSLWHGDAGAGAGAAAAAAPVEGERGGAPFNASLNV